MKLIFFFLFLSVYVFTNGQNPKEQTNSERKNPVEGKQTAKNYTYKVLPSINGTWGYTILKEKKIFIHQASIPGLPGNEGFKSKSDAGKVARLVIKKLKKGEMPPTVSKDELTNLNILLTK